MFPKSKMLHGQFLGIAKNIGDAFCFLVVTDSEDTKKSQQVIWSNDVTPEKLHQLWKRCFQRS
jgi:glycerol-3-phosphate cytidylyltransferase-like family protein